MPELNALSLSIPASATMGAAAAATDHPDPINLAVGEPEELPAAPILKAFSQAIEDGHLRYGPAQGIPQLRESLAQVVGEQNGVSFSSENVIVTAGGKPALMDTLRSLLSPGDEVIVFAPYWPTFIQQVEWCGAKAVVCPADDDLLPNLEVLNSLFSARTKAIIINSPSNPTSLVYPESILTALAQLAQENDLWVLSDQVYVGLAFADEIPRLLQVAPEIKEQTIIIESFSKSYSMTGIRLGCAVGPSKLIDSLAKLAQATTTHPCMPAQYAGLCALSMDQSWVLEQRRRYGRRAELVGEALCQVGGVELRKPEAAFYVFPQVQGWLEQNDVVDDRALASVLLQKEGLKVVPGSAFGTPGFLRLSCGLADERLQEAMGRLQSFMAGK